MDCAKVILYRKLWHWISGVSIALRVQQTSLWFTFFLQIISLLNRNIKDYKSSVNQLLNQMLVSIPYCMSWMNQFMNDFLSVGARKSLFMCKEAISLSRLFCSLPASILLFLSNSPVPFYHQTSFRQHFLSLHPSSSLFLCCSPSSLLSAALFHSPCGVDHVWMGLNDGWEGGCMQCSHRTTTHVHGT